MIRNLRQKVTTMWHKLVAGPLRWYSILCVGLVEVSPTQLAAISRVCCRLDSDLSTIALALVFFDKLVLLKSVVNKVHRRSNCTSCCHCA
jgi:hypothetical protein